MSHPGRLAYSALLRTARLRASSCSVTPQSADNAAAEVAAGDACRTVSSYYYNNQSALEAAAAKKSVRLTPASLLYAGRASDPHQLLRSAQYLHRELPVRIAHRVADFRALPFLVACNPAVLSAHEMYMRAFRILSGFPAIATPEDEARYSVILRQLLDDHKDIVTTLADGFRECGRHARDPQLVAGFLDKTLTARLGIRLLCEHHLAVRQDRPDFVGVVATKFCPGDVVESRAALVARMCEMKFGTAPAISVDGGGRRAAFAYIQQPVEYILTELLKNAFRATVEFNRGRQGPLPEVRVTVADNDFDFVIRITDRGGGIPHDLAGRIFDYNFSTAEASEQHESFLDRVSEARGNGAMHGFGFGLPMSRAYARYLGGALTFETMQGHGSDFYLRLKHIDGRGESFRI